MRQWEWINNSFFSTYSSIVKTAMEGTEAVLCTVTWQYWISSKYKCTPFNFKWTVSSLINKFEYVLINYSLFIKLLNLFKWIVSSLINKFELYVLLTLCSLNFWIYSWYVPWVKLRVWGKVQSMLLQKMSTFLCLLFSVFLYSTICVLHFGDHNFYFRP